MVGVLAVTFFVEYETARSFGLDEVWFGEAVRKFQTSWPGRPSPLTASSVLPLAAAVALFRVDRWTRAIWPSCMAGGAAIPFVTVAAYLFDAVALVGVTPSSGQAFSTGAALLLLIAATALARPDRFALAWPLARPDRRSLVRLAGILAGFPIVVAATTPTFGALGLGEHAEWTFSILFGTVVVGVVTFFFSRREQKLLIEKELVSNERADAEARYRILADNAVDIIVHLRGVDVAWVSPSVQAALGDPCNGGSAQASAATSTPMTASHWQRPSSGSPPATRSGNGSGSAPPTTVTTGSTVTESLMSMRRAAPMG